MRFNSKPNNIIEGVKIEKNENPSNEDILRGHMFAMRNGFAGMAMQALLTRGEDDVVKKSVMIADQMMEEIFGKSASSKTEG